MLSSVTDIIETESTPMIGTATNAAPSSRSAPPLALVEKPKIFGGIDFKRWQ